MPANNWRKKLKQILEADELPMILGGDHSIAIGSFAGVASFCRKKQDQTMGLIWFDAHADMNTPETTPSGNIHGMPLARCLDMARPSSRTSVVLHPSSIRSCAFMWARATSIPAKGR